MTSPGHAADTRRDDDRRAYTWARVNVSILHDPRFATLPATGFRLYFTCYLLAFEHRSETLPPWCNLQGCSIFARLDRRTAAKMLQKCVELGLLAVTPDGRITVTGASKNGDPRMQWDATNAGPSTRQTETISDTDRQTEQPTEKNRPTEQTDGVDTLPAGSQVSLSVMPACLPETPTLRPTPAPPTFAGLNPFQAIRLAVNGTRTKSEPQLEVLGQSKPIEKVLAACAEVHKAKCQGRLDNPGGLLRKLLSEIHP